MRLSAHPGKLRAIMMRRLTLLVFLSVAEILIAGCAPPAGRTPRPPNVLLVVIDTLRADAVFGYGAPESQTPTIAALAREGTLFTHVRSTGAWTAPAHASLFTGLYPSRHGAHHEGGALSLEAVTLAELLSESHDTAAFCENPHLVRKMGFAQGFGRFLNTWHLRRSPRTRELPTLRAAKRWLADRAPDRPFLLFFNDMTPHLPYQPPSRYQARFVSADADASRLAELRAVGDEEARLYIAGRLRLDPSDLSTLRRLYAAEVAFADARLGVLLELLRSRGWLDETLVVVVGDHGENIGDHGLMEHQFSLYESLIRVPLVMRLPGTVPAGVRRDEPVQLVDLFPTVLELAGVPRQRWPVQEGVSLFGRSLDAERQVIAEYMVPLDQEMIFAREIPDFDFSPLRRSLRSIQIGPSKLIVSGSGELELFDLESDPDEQVDLARRRPETVRRLLSRLERWQSAAPETLRSLEPELDEETRE